MSTHSTKGTSPTCLERLSVILPVAVLLFSNLVNGAVLVRRGYTEGPKCPLDDPLLRPESTPITLTMDPITEFKNGSYLENVNIIGLSTMRYNISMNVLLLTANFQLTIPKVEGTAKYQAEGFMDARPLPDETVPSGNFTGGGDAYFLIEGVSAKGFAKLKPNIVANKIQLLDLSLTEVVFQNIKLQFEGCKIDGKLIDWEAFNGRVKQNFDRDWPIHREALTEKIKAVTNTYVDKYTITELIDRFKNGSSDCREASSS